MSNQLILGDCLEKMKELPDESVDAVVTDPPYGLGTKEPTPEDILAYLSGKGLAPLKKGRKHCANSVIGLSVIPEANDGEPETPQDFVTFRIVVPSLAVVQARGVQLNDQVSLGEQEVNGESPVFKLDNVLVDEPHSKSGESFHYGKFCLRERKSFAGCVEACCCFTQTGPTTFRVLVWLGHDSLGEAEGPSNIVAGTATEVRAVLTLDMRRKTGELGLADPADDPNSGLLLASQNVGANLGASRLLASLQVGLTGQVGHPANGAGSFDISLPAVLVRRFHTPRVDQKDFMGKAWEIPSVEVWKECYRVLKPGGHLLSFAGTRTWDLMGVGIRAAGFESRDSIAMARGNSCWAWCHGQGFPKSLNISVALDKMAGAEREVIGKLPHPTSNVPRVTMGRPATVGSGFQESPDLTAPTTDEAKKWTGWGTALKPSWEPILVFRKPLSEKTIAANVLEHGTGGLNIGACRVGTGDNLNGGAYSDGGRAQPMSGDEREGASLGMYEPGRKANLEYQQPSGRWPPNLVLVHSPGCKRVGTKQVTCGPWGSGKSESKTPSWKSSGETRPIDNAQFKNADGTETVEAWECVDGCPVKMLDEQSGNLSSHPSYGIHEQKSEDTSVNFNGRAITRPGVNQHADSGGASRFFPQFPGQEPPLAPFFYTGKATKSETTLDGQVENNHPTKKPLELMKWLVKLVCPKDGVTLDPYAGSGTTLVAAVEQGSHYIGIERDPDYHKIIKARLAIVEEKYTDKRNEMDGFELAMSLDEDE
jgi:DNA modification methylase